MPHRVIARRVAQDLLRIGAVSLAPDEPFTWASGLKAPIYCDNRVTIAFPDVRARIAEGFEKLLLSRAIEPDVIAGTATAGIPHAAFLAARMDLPMVYVRAQPKGHGRGSQIEGRIEAGQRVVVVEDLISTGGSSASVVQALQAAGAEVLAVLAIFSYGLDAARATYVDLGLPLLTLCSYDHLIDLATDEESVDQEALATLQAWRRDPQRWSEQWKQEGKALRV